MFYGADSYKAQLQSGQSVQARRMLRGLVSISLIGNGPSLAFFFATYDGLKRQPWVGDSSFGVLLASMICAVPASLIAVPGDTLKKRVVLGVDRTPLRALRSVLAVSPGGLMIGWQANLIKDIPFAAVKMSLYEGMLRLWASVLNKPTELVQPTERAAVGFCSGAVTAVLTNPLDVVNTRIKGSLLPVEVNGIRPGIMHIVKTEGPLALTAGIGPRVFIIGLGSSLFFWVLEHAKVIYDTKIDTSR